MRSRISLGNLAKKGETVSCFGWATLEAGKVFVCTLDLDFEGFGLEGSATMSLGARGSFRNMAWDS